MTFAVHVDLTNPGQFFACCGLFELASRLTGDASARFEGARFMVECECTLTQLLDRLTQQPLVQVDPDNDTSSPITIDGPFEILLDWWERGDVASRDLKVWAGSMQNLRIAQAMLAALRDARFHTETLFDVGCVVYDPADPAKKVEPFYFDARRAPNAHARDVGFSPDALDLITVAYPAVEALCLVGLQRFRPAPTNERRVFTYRAWAPSLVTSVAAAVAGGAVALAGSRAFRFESWFRTGQRKAKAFRPAVLIAEGD